MTTLLQDLRYAFRHLRLSPGFAIICILTLALGIGANTAIFTLVNAVMLKNLPVANPNELYRLGNNNNCCVNGGMQDEWGIYPYGFYKQVRDNTPEFSELAAFQAGQGEVDVRRLNTNSAPESYIGEFVSGNYFSTFGLKAFAGRTITPADDASNAAPVAMVSYHTWLQHFALDPSVIGGSFVINQVPFTIVGVTPPNFFGETLRPDPPDFFLPIATEQTLSVKAGLDPLVTSTLQWLYIIGRIKPGANPAVIQSETTVELQQWLPSDPNLTDYDRSQISKQHIVVVPAGVGVASMERDTSAGLRLLMIISGLVLLIACANIANLLLARGAASSFETAVRVALGAPRGRLIRQIITESVLLAIIGGVLGLCVAYAGTRMILVLIFRGARYVPIDATPSLPVLGFAFALSLITGIVFGVVPALITSRTNPAETLRGIGRSTRDHSSLPRKSLVVLQVALSAVLLIGAGLLTQALRNLENQRFGFEPEGRVIVRVSPGLAGYKVEGLYALYQQLEQRLPQIPGVLSASFSLYSPMRGDNWGLGISIEGHSPDDRTGSSFDRVGPHYFETIGTLLVRGRVIGDEDTPNSRFVAVINQTFASKFFPDSDPIGKHFGMGDQTHRNDFEIVGIVEDAKYQDAREPAYPTFFLPFMQIVQDPKMSFLMGSQFIQDIELRVAAKPQDLEANVRQLLAEINPNLTVSAMLSLDEQLTRNFNQDRLIASLTELFGILALLLACLGLYGVTSYSVARRTSEIGIRMALGADRASVLSLVLRSVLAQLGIGLAIGLPAALLGGKLMATQLYGVKGYDPAILALAIVVLTVCAISAGFIPANRGASIDPMRALRTD
jgi:predicted permease